MAMSENISKYLCNFVLFKKITSVTPHRVHIVLSCKHGKHDPFISTIKLV